jgi:hypothetical protein
VVQVQELIAQGRGLEVEFDVLLTLSFCLCLHEPSTVRFTHCNESVNELGELQQFASLSLGETVCHKMRESAARFRHQCQCVLSVTFWRSLREGSTGFLVERLGSQTGLSELAFIFQFEI